MARRLYLAMLFVMVFLGSCEKKQYDGTTKMFKANYIGQLPSYETPQTLDLVLQDFCDHFDLYDPSFGVIQCRSVMTGINLVFREPWSQYTPRRDIPGPMVGETLAKRTIMIATVFPLQPNKVAWGDTALHHELVHFMLHYGYGGDVCASHEERCGWDDQLWSLIAHMRNNKIYGWHEDGI